MTQKPIISETPAEVVSKTVRFDNVEFDKLIYDKGYDVLVDKALRCPCVVKGTGQPLPNCKNCLSVGWIFIDRKETRLVIQGIKADVKYENWSQTTTGMAKVTARAKDRLCFMDRIIVKEAEGVYQETLKPILFNGKITAYPIYIPLEIEDIYAFDTISTPLTKLVEGVDFTLIENKIEFDAKFLTKVQTAVNTLSVSIRYTHNLTFHIIDMNRDVMKVKVGKCSIGESTADMPVAGTMRKAHYIFDNTKFEENTLIENSHV